MYVRSHFGSNPKGAHSRLQRGREHKGKSEAMQCLLYCPKCNAQVYDPWALDNHPDTVAAIGQDARSSLLEHFLSTPMCRLRIRLRSNPHLSMCDWHNWPDMGFLEVARFSVHHQVVLPLCDPDSTSESDTVAYEARAQAKPKA